MKKLNRENAKFMVVLGSDCFTQKEWNKILNDEGFAESTPCNNIVEEYFDSIEEATKVYNTLDVNITKSSGNFYQQYKTIFSLEEDCNNPKILLDEYAH